MSARLKFFALMGLVALPAAATADPYLFPEIQNQPQPYPRPSYRQTHFPPPQHTLLGTRAAPTGLEPRPGYRAAAPQFPPAGGRYGGGFIEWVLTGGRPEPIDPRYPNAMPQLMPARASAVEPAPASAHGRLPHSGLPDYSAIQSQADAGAAPVALPQAALPQATLPQVMAYAAPAGEPAASEAAIAAGPADPAFVRQMVAYSGRQSPGTVVIDTPHKYLYLVQPGGQALRYGIGVGRPGFTWSGVKAISRKAEWPAWTPPARMLKRRPDLPHHMTGGMENPLGARAMYLGSSIYRIHGTNEPMTIGTNVSSGCIRMMNQDVIDLYDRVRIGTRVVVL